MCEMHTATRARGEITQKDNAAVLHSGLGGLCNECVPLSRVNLFFGKFNIIGAPEEPII